MRVDPQDVLLNGSRHLPGIPDSVATVATVGFQQTQVVVQKAVEHNEIAVFTGQAGLGKTFAVDYAVQEAPLPSLWIQIGPATTPKEVTARLSRELIGTFPRGVLYEITDELVAGLVDDRHIVVVDEAQNLNKKGLDQVRLLHDLSGAGFPLLFVGGARCAAVLASDAQLEDRVGGWVEFAPLTDRHLFAALDAYHPLLAHTDRHLLAAIDKAYARGVFRRWARFLKSVLPTIEDSDKPGALTEKVATAALTTLMRAQL